MIGVGQIARTNSTTILFLAVLLGCGIETGRQPLFGQDASSTQSETEVPKFAILIGIDDYKHLSPAEQLDGSSNDIQLIRSVLVNRFGFDEERIIELVNEQATAAGIREAFDNLISMVDGLPPDAPLAQVYFHFSGHGSQVADQPEGDSDRDEPDGLDETLVPHDAERQGGNNDIRDDEINDLIARVVGDEAEPRAQLVLVYDCCHSGSGARGDTKVRQLRRSIAKTSVAQNVIRKRLPPGVVFLSACHETEVEPEFREDGKAYGLLTRFLSQVLTEQESVSTLSYDLLHDAIRARYRSNARVVQAPHPQLESSDLNTRRLPILGATKAIDRPATYPLRRGAASSPSHLQAGRLHGLTVGSVLDVYGSPEGVASAEPIAMVKIRSVKEFESEVAFVSVDGQGQIQEDVEPPASLPVSAVAVLRSAGPPSSLTRLKILVDSDDARPVSAELAGLPTGLASQLRELATEGDRQSIEIAETTESDADLVLKVSGEQSSLFPASGLALDTSGEAASFLRGGWGPFDAAGLDAEGMTVGDYIERIAKARKLVALASSARTSVTDLEVSFELLSVETNEDQEITATHPIEMTEDKRIVLEVGDQYAVRFENSQGSKRPVYFTALEVTPDMGIQVVAPYMETEIKLEPGESYLCDPFECDAPGRLYELLLATSEPHDFSFVEQDDLPKTRGSSAAGGSADLQDALAGALFPNAAKSRGRRVPKKKSESPWLTKVIEWEVLPSSLASQMTAMKTRGAPPGAAPTASKSIPQSSPTTSLTTSATDEGFELVKVFYGTDREAIVDGERKSEFIFPTIPAVCGAVLAILSLLCLRNPGKVWIGLTTVALLATGVTTLDYVNSMQNRDIALQRTGVQYGSGRGKLEVGTCDISIPKDHRIGLIESPSIFTLDFREDPKRHVIVESMERTEYDEFFVQLNEVIKQSPRREAMVFVHGYNVTFDDAARRTGQMAYDLKYLGAPIFFSWPSQATEIGYTVDENNVTWAVPHLKQFLEDIRKKTDVQSLNIIAHSMGNRAVTSVLKELNLEYKEQGRFFNQVILAAPDVDAEVFKTEIAPRIVQTAAQVTLYASSKDQALVASKTVHGYPRAGESGENLVVVDDIHTIDVTEIDTSLLGHNYYGDSDSIVADIYKLLHRDEPPEERGLRESFVNSLKYWVFAKNE